MPDTAIVEQKLVEALRPNLTELVVIWDYVGYQGEERAKHEDQVVKKLRGLLEEIVSQEHAARLEIEQRVENWRREVAELCQQLRMPSYLPDRGLSSSEMMKVLEEKTNELQSLKRSRCSDYHRIRLSISRLSRLLKEPSDMSMMRLAKFPPIIEQECLVKENGDGVNLNQIDAMTAKRIPEEREIIALQETYDELNAIYAPLAAQHAAFREDIARIALDIAYEPQSEEETAVLKAAGLSHLCAQPAMPSTPGVVRKFTGATGEGLSNGDAVSTTSSTQESYEPIVDEATLKWLNDWRFKLVKAKARLVGSCEELRAYLSIMWLRLDKPVEEQTTFLEVNAGYRPDILEALQEEVDRCQQMKWEKLDTYLQRLTLEATKLARTCCMDEKIVQLPSGQDRNDPEVVANHLETVLEQLNQTYATYRPIFEGIAVYEEQWHALMDVELRLKDPAIFSNRGGILLKTEKEKKRLLKEVQRSEQDVLTTIENHEIRTKSSFHLADGRTFKDYIGDRWASCKQSRDPSRVRKSVTASVNTSRPNSSHYSTPPGCPT